MITRIPVHMGGCRTTGTLVRGCRLHIPRGLSHTQGLVNPQVGIGPHYSGGDQIDVCCHLSQERPSGCGATQMYIHGGEGVHRDWRTYAPGFQHASTSTIDSPCGQWDQDRPAVMYGPWLHWRVKIRGATVLAITTTLLNRSERRALNRGCSSRVPEAYIEVCR